MARRGASGSARSLRPLSLARRPAIVVAPMNIKVGLGLCHDDSLAEASRLFRDIDLLLLLGVYPGFGGQSMQLGTRERVATARSLADKETRRISIAVDGGVNPENAVQLVQAGADTLIMGTALFQADDMTETVRSIRASIEESLHH